MVEHIAVVQAVAYLRVGGFVVGLLTGATTGAWLLLAAALTADTASYGLRAHCARTHRDGAPPMAECGTHRNGLHASGFHVGRDENVVQLAAYRRAAPVTQIGDSRTHPAQGKESIIMALPTSTPPAMTANTDGPSRLRVRWRRLRFAVRRDPLATVTSPSVAVRLADELLARTAVARPDTEMWCSVAVRPLAALLDSASPAGTGCGIGWVRETVSGIHSVDPGSAIWDEAQAACNRPAGSVQFRTALPWLRGLDSSHRCSVTFVMRDAVAFLR